MQQEHVAEQKHEYMKLIFCRKYIFAIIVTYGIFTILSSYFIARIANSEGGITKLTQQHIHMMLFQLWLVPHPFQGACIHGRYPASSTASSCSKHGSSEDFECLSLRVSIPSKEYMVGTLLHRRHHRAANMAVVRASSVHPFECPSLPRSTW